MGFRHGHFCTNDYPYSFCMGFRHAHFCTNDYPFLVVLVFVRNINDENQYKEMDSHSYKDIHNNNSYNVLSETRYSRFGKHCAHGETETLVLNKPKNLLFPFNRNVLERNWD